MPGGRKSKLTNEMVLDAMRRAAGIKSAAARALGVTRQTIYNYIIAHPEIKPQIDEICEITLDMAESKVYQAINEGDGQMVRWFLDRRGRSRGYGQTTRSEVTGKDGAPLLPPTIDVSKLTFEEQKLLLEMYSKASDDADAE